MPCNFNQRRLADKVKQGVREAGGTPMEINTISISDAVPMGTVGHESLPLSAARSLPIRSSWSVGAICSTPWS